MKQMNFPGRVNERRIKALQRLEKSQTTTKSDEDRKRVTAEIGTLKSRIMSEEEARSLRTKKVRIKESEKIK